MAIVFSGGTHHLVGVDLGNNTPIEVAGAVLHMEGVRCGDITVTSGLLYGSEVDCAAITVTASALNSAYLTGVRARGDVTFAGGAGLQVIHATGLYMDSGTAFISTGTFEDWSVTGLVAGRGSPAGSRIDITDLTNFVFEGKMNRSQQHGARFEDCTTGEVSLHIFEPSAQTNNTYDGISLEGVCDRLSIRGSVIGAGSNLPAYGVDIGASCLDIHLWMAISGTATGLVDDNTSGEVTVH